MTSVSPKFFLVRFVCMGPMRTLLSSSRVRQVVVTMNIVRYHLSVCSQVAARRNGPNFGVVFRMSVRFEVVVVVSRPRYSFRKVQRFQVVLLNGGVVVRSPICHFLLAYNCVVQVFSRVSNDLLGQCQGRFASKSEYRTGNEYYPLFCTRVTNGGASDRGGYVFPHTLCRRRGRGSREERS